MLGMECSWETSLLVAVMALAAEFVDSTLGMGYGTILSPVLLLMGYQPLQVVPAILLSQLVTGFEAAAAHHIAGNVDFTKRPPAEPGRRRIGGLPGLLSGRWLPHHFRIVLMISLCGVLGSVVAVRAAVSVPVLWVKLYIGGLVMAIGAYILATLNRPPHFSWARLGGWGLLASFNKGVTGGGYGPVVTGGQLLAGVPGKNAVGITSFAEGLTCTVSVVGYLLMGKKAEWNLAPALVIGAVLAVPFSAWAVRRIETYKLRIGIGVLTLGLGAFTLYRVLF